MDKFVADKIKAKPMSNCSNCGSFHGATCFRITLSHMTFEICGDCAKTLGYTK